jgi:Domain of unknown function (DUF3291)
MPPLVDRQYSGGLMDWYLAQLNIGRLRAPVGDPLVAEFIDNLDRINALADASPGFVWRLQTEDGNATAVRPFDDETILVNMSVWESVSALGDYVYRSGHVEFLRRKREWFERAGEAHLVLWWVPAGTVPTPAEAIARLERLRSSGPSPEAFTFARPFGPPSASSDEATDILVEPDDRNACPA